MYFIYQGEVELVHKGETGNGSVEVGDEAAPKGTVTGEGDEKLSIKRLGEGDPFGVLSILATHKRRAATARALTPVKVYKIDRSQFKKLLASSPDMQHEARSLAYQRLDTFAQDVPQLDDVHWKEQTLRTLDKLSMDVSDAGCLLEFSMMHHPPRISMNCARQ